MFKTILDNCQSLLLLLLLLLLLHNYFILVFVVVGMTVLFALGMQRAIACSQAKFK